MSESENEQVVLKAFEGQNRLDLEAYLDCYNNGATSIDISGTRTILDKARTRERVRKAVREGYSDPLDRTRRVDRMISQGNTVVVEWTWSGTHKGEYLGIPATNKTFEISGASILEFEAGKIKLGKHYWNQRRLEQLLRE